MTRSLLTVCGAEDVDAWVNEVQQQLKDALTKGPIIIK
jgi:hypothetical protein